MASEAIAACRLRLYSCEPQMNRMTLPGTKGPDPAPTFQPREWPELGAKPTFMKPPKPFHNTIGNSVRR